MGTEAWEGRTTPWFPVRAAITSRCWAWSLQAWAGGLIRYYEKPQCSAVIISVLASGLKALRLHEAPTNDRFWGTDRSRISNPDQNDSAAALGAESCCFWVTRQNKSRLNPSASVPKLRSRLRHRLAFSCLLTKKTKKGTTSWAETGSFQAVFGFVRQNRLLLSATFYLNAAKG